MLCEIKVMLSLSLSREIMEEMEAPRLQSSLSGLEVETKPQSGLSSRSSRSGLGAESVSVERLIPLFSPPEMLFLLLSSELSRLSEVGCRLKLFLSVRSLAGFSLASSSRLLPRLLRSLLRTQVRLKFTLENILSISKTDRQGIRCKEHLSRLHWVSGLSTKYTENVPCISLGELTWLAVSFEKPKTSSKILFPI